MRKIKQSIAVQRQIPEHIRENYPAFVEFVKVYYDFLEQTQAQNLEQIHDIDTTLEEFIDRFKSELAKNIPIEQAGDKRLLLQHLREFYLARGSEESFKFIFKALFGKEAQLSYPSTQMLRVSDGKWQQDTSVFLDLDAGTESLAGIAGKFVIITTSRKTIQTFVSSVSKYSSNISEVFIDKDFAKEIEVGSILTYIDENSVKYSGKVLACPSSIKVYKSGKGFKVGSLYSLKTSLGNGCVVKITKVDSDGGIKGVQVIKFGLDYKSKFYSYLSSKQFVAYEYLHPLQLGSGSADTRTYTASLGQTNFSVNYLIENSTPLLVVEVIRNNAPVTVTYTATNNTSVNIVGIEEGDTVKLYGVTTKGVAPTRDLTTYTATPNASGMQTFALDYITFDNIPQLYVEVKRNGQPVYVTYVASSGISVTLYGLQTGDVVSLSNQPSYNERSGGFIDYGYASTQTYFEYDETIPVQKEVAVINGQTLFLDTRGSDRYFAEPSYVGEIIRQFYTDASSSVFDNDLAIIEVNLGAVARYPGYYRAADGFISDEMYIQDGKQYQAFSYVIRVEEELRKYADIIKALVHPSGMKMFAEYNIFNELNVSASLPFIFKVIQFADSIDQVRDLSYNYDKYEVVIEDGEIKYVPAGANLDADPPYLGAAKVYALPGKLANFPTKNLVDATVENFTSVSTTNPAWNIIRNYDETLFKFTTKNLVDATIEGFTSVIAKNNLNVDTDWLIQSNYSETESKFSSKVLNTNTDALADAVSKNPIKNLSDAQSNTVALDKSFVMGTKSDQISERLVQALSSDGQWTVIRSYDETIQKDTVKPLTDSTVENLITTSIQDIDGITTGNLVRSFSETISKLMLKNFVENQLNSDVYSLFTEKSLSDVQSNIDILVSQFFKNLDDTQFFSDDSIKSLFKNIDEVILNSEIIVNDTSKNVSDIQIIIELLSNGLIKDTFADSQSLIDIIINNAIKNFIDEQFSADSSLLNPEKNLVEIIQQLDTTITEYDKTILETVLQLSAHSTLYDKAAIEETLTLSETFEIIRAKIFEEIISLIQSSTSSINKEIVDMQSTIEDLANIIAKDVLDVVVLIEIVSSKQSDKIIEESIELSDILQSIRTKISNDFISISDSYLGLNIKNISDQTLAMISVQVKDPSKLLYEPINISTNGRLSLNPYDSGDPDTGYFEFYQDYIAKTAIS